MKCPRCESQGKTSTFKLLNGTTRSHPNVETYYDELGKLHEHNNVCVSNWECSEGHKLSKQTKLGCGGCLEKNEEHWQ
jgi:hypothetical protein